MILSCKCENKQQDEIHGKGRRVHNPCGKSGRVAPGKGASKPTMYRCTVCLAEKEVHG